MKNGQVALALTGGYLLGRTHKMRWALALAGMAAGNRLRSSGGVGEKLLKSPELSELTHTMRDELLTAGRSAAVAAAGNRIDSLSDRMQQRASQLRAGPDAEEGEESGEEPRGEEEERDEEEEEPGEEEPRGEEEEEPGEEERPARKRGVSGKGRTRTSATRPARDKKRTTAGSRETAGKETASAGSSGGRSTQRRSRGDTEGR